MRKVHTGEVLSVLVLFVLVLSVLVLSILVFSVLVHFYFGTFCFDTFYVATFYVATFCLFGYFFHLSRGRLVRRQVPCKRDSRMQRGSGSEL